jgi:hypothetical protein
MQVPPISQDTLTSLPLLPLLLLLLTEEHCATIVPLT